MATRIYSINEIRQMAAPIATAYGIRKLALFGSYARGDATEDSDIDFLIADKGALRGLFRLAGFHCDLKERFGMDVDVVTEDSLDDEFLANAKAEEVMIYESQQQSA